MSTGAGDPSDDDDDAGITEELIRATHQHLDERRDQTLPKHLPFSWGRVLCGFASLVLVCSDIPRSGLGYRSFVPAFHMVEPEVLQSFGPWYYSVQTLTKSTAKNATGKVWSYKYDSTSVSWRAFAEFYHLDTFPPCVMYREYCTADLLGGDTVFSMLDSIASATFEYGNRKRQRRETVASNSEPVGVILRTESSFLDRLHHYLLPQLFMNKIWRTSQALYYSSEFFQQTSSAIHSNICFGKHAVRPHFCHELWVNFRRSCLKSDRNCREIGLVWTHILKRVRDVEQKHPGMQVDLTVLESQEDLQRCIGGLSLTGVRKSDIATIIRARDCNINSTASAPNTTTTAICNTVFVDEYRYQIGLVTTDALQWYRFVSTLRIVGQLYFYLRIFLLLQFCYVIQPRGRQAIAMWNVTTRLQKAIVLFVRTPVQSVVFGSPFPILCYACAHLIDSPITYEILSKKFTTQGGVFTLNFRDFCLVAFIQMRNVWVLAAALHAVVAVTTSRWQLNWYPVGGILGIPEFLLGGLSCLTIWAQFRSTRFRWTKVHAIFELEQSSEHQEIKYRHQFGHRGSGNTQLGGVFVDLKFIFCLLLLVLLVVGFRNCALACSRLMGVPTKTTAAWSLCAKSPVPYSAGIMWPTVAMCVHWSSDYYVAAAASISQPQPGSSRRITTLLRQESSRSTLKKSPRRKLSQVRSFVTDTMTSISPVVLMSSRTFESLQSQMEKLHQREDARCVNVAMVNLIFMSDPLNHLLYIRAGGGAILGYYQSMRNPQVVLLLPRDAVAVYNTETKGLRLLGYVRSSQLKWSQLI
ncbi:hypothetical protein Gpo141_00010788 [Globisporangium polare]